MPYSIDTRTLRPGDTYVAIVGERHDGHDFIPEAIEKGAAGVVAEQDVDVPEGVTVTRVEDARGHLVEEASEKVRRVGPDVVAITGSMGKTTTRAAARAVLAEAFDVVVSEGNRNTPLGLALLVLNRDLAPQTKLVLEMGARQRGDLEELCAAFPPAVSVVTNVRAVHIETLGSLEGVAQEKGAVVRALGPGGTACLNGDDARVRAMGEGHAGRTITYGTGAGCDLGPEHITAPLPMLGEHATCTALAAMSVGHAFGMSGAAMGEGLAKMEPEKGRLRRLRGRSGSVLIDDSYNASPAATRAALRVLGEQAGAEEPAAGEPRANGNAKTQPPQQQQQQRRRVAFLGDMLELGATEVDQHTQLLAEAVSSVDVLHAVGDLMARGARALPPAARGQVTVHAGSSELAAALRAGRVYEPQAGDVILVKGSQGARMERLSEALLHPDLAPEDVLPRQSESWKQIA